MWLLRRGVNKNLLPATMKSTFEALCSYTGSGYSVKHEMELLLNRQGMYCSTVVLLNLSLNKS